MDQQEKEYALEVWYDTQFDDARFEKARRISIEALESVAIPSADRWIPVSERLPKEEDYKPSYEVSDGAVLVTTEDGLVGEGYFYDSTKTWSDIEDNPISVKAWQPLPESWKGFAYYSQSSI